MRKPFVFVGLLATIFSGMSVFAQGPCSVQSSKLACVIPQEYGFAAAPGGQRIPNFNNVLYDAPVSPLAPPGIRNSHPGHYVSDFSGQLASLAGAIGRQANLLPIASPSSGVLLTYDPSVKTFVISTNSLGPILGERGDTIGRHKLFVGFSYQYFNFDKIDHVNMRNIPAIQAHRPDNVDDTVPGTLNPINCDPTVSSSAHHLGGCSFVRDLVSTQNSIALKINQYTGYITFGLTSHVDLSMVIPFETVGMSVYSNDKIIPGSDGSFTPTPGSPDSYILNQNGTSNGQPYFFHLFKDCPDTSPASGLSGLAAQCVNHTFPDPRYVGNGSSAVNSASGIGDVVARVKWNAWSGERFRFASGLDVRFPTGDALNYLGSGSYGLVGYEWNSNSILSSRLSSFNLFGVSVEQVNGLATGKKGYMPSDFIYTAGADAWLTKWLTASFDIVGARFLRAGTEAVTAQQFLAPCTGGCTAEPSPGTVSHSTLLPSPNASYSVNNASAGAKIRPLPKASKLVLTANVLVRLDSGGLHAKPAPLVGLGYTF